MPCWLFYWTHNYCVLFYFVLNFAAIGNYFQDVFYIYRKKSNAVRLVVHAGLFWLGRRSKDTLTCFFIVKDGYAQVVSRGLKHT